MIISGPVQLYLVKDMCLKRDKSNSIVTIDEGRVGTTTLADSWNINFFNNLIVFMDTVTLVRPKFPNKYKF